MTDRLAEFSKRIPQGTDAVLITSQFNRRYYTGFPSSAGTLVVTGEKSYFIIDSRYFEAASMAVKGCEVILQDKTYEQVSGLLRKHNIKTLGIEADYTSVAEFSRLVEKLPGVKILNDGGISGIIARQRAVKDADEIASIQKSQDIADKTFSHILNFIKPGVTENEIAAEMEHYSKKLGSRRPSFDFIVAAGPNGSRPHAVPGDNRVKDGDLIVMDFGMTFEDYCSDMTRTVGVGNVGDKQRQVYEIVLKAQLAGLLAIQPGAKCFDVDKAARDVIDESAYKGLCGHGIGHSLGLEVHENPRFNTVSEDVLQKGHVMSMEPGIYLPGEFGVRIEDIIVVTESGYDNFAHSPKELIIL